MPGSTRREQQLEIEQDIDFQRRAWRIQRVGWVAIALLLGAGAAGLFGLGPLSRSRLILSPTLELQYYRWARAHAPLELRFRVQPEDSDTFRLHVASALLDRMEIQRIDPEPAATIADSTGQSFAFLLDGPTGIVFHVEPTRMGRVRGEIRSGRGGRAVPLTVLP